MTDQPASEVTAAASAGTDTGIQPGVTPSLVTLGIFVACAIIGTVLDGNAGAPPSLAEGLSAFALFYVVAQAAERLVELATPLWGLIPGLNKVKTLKSLHSAVAEALNATQTLPPDHSSPSPDQAAADAQAALDQVVANRRVVTFGLTAGLAMIGCAALHIDFLTTSGLTFPTTTWANEAIRVIVTGLVVGGGSAGLHNLIGQMGKSSADAGSPPETTGS